MMPAIASGFMRPATPRRTSSFRAEPEDARGVFRLHRGINAHEAIELCGFLSFALSKQGFDLGLHGLELSDLVVDALLGSGKARTLALVSSSRWRSSSASRRSARLSSAHPFPPD